MLPFKLWVIFYELSKASLKSVQDFLSDLTDRHTFENRSSLQSVQRRLCRVKLILFKFNCLHLFTYIHVCLLFMYLASNTFTFVCQFLFVFLSVFAFCMLTQTQTHHSFLYDMKVAFLQIFRLNVAHKYFLYIFSNVYCECTKLSYTVSGTRCMSHKYI